MDSSASKRNVVARLALARPNRLALTLARSNRLALA